jgi:hypothetical protein
MNTIPGGSWPTISQELLLKAALLKGNACLNAWEQWKKYNEIEQIDDGSHRLLPLTYYNLSAQGVQDSLLIRLKSVYRYMLSRNHLMFYQIIPALSALKKLKIKTMLLKGAALTLTHYKNYALRPQLDIDILVPEIQASKAFEYFQRHGWRPEYQYALEKVLQFRHSCGFDAGMHKRIDLHWNIFQECREPGIDDIFWQNAVAVVVNDVKTLALSETHQFLHTCIHGVKWNTIMPCRWVADAITILNQSHGDIGWDDLVELARERALTVPLRHALTYLHDAFEAEIPESTLSRLDKTPVSFFERLEFRVMITKKSIVFGNFFKFAVGYLRVPHSKNILIHIFNFFSFLQMQWKIRYLFLMPFVLVRDAIRSFVKKRKQ